MSRTRTRQLRQSLVGFLLLLWGNGALAFTLIEIPDEVDAPGGSIADAITLGVQFRPLLDAIQSHLHENLREDTERRSAAVNAMLASNTHAATASDAYFIKVANHGDRGNLLHSVWLGTSFTHYSNDFSRTEFNGESQLLLAGFDLTADERYIFGLALGYETGTTDTEFNAGGQNVDGYNISPYFAYLITDSLSVDVSLSLGKQDTDQSRAVVAILPGPVLTVDSVDSDYSSDLNFIASNLTYSAPRGNWYLTGWLGFLVGEKNQDDYTESDSTDVEGQDLDIKRWYLGGEAAYGHEVSETYFGLIYEKDTDVNEIEFDSGEQPANDDDSTLVTLGWRYFGADLSANIELSSRVGYEDNSETTISTTLRLDL